MAFYILAPFDLTQATMMLPSPKLGDTVNPDTVVTVRNSMNGILYSYKQSSDQIKLSYDFILDEEKAIELEYFVLTYSGYAWRVIDHRDQVFHVQITSIPLEFSSIMINERKQVRLEFEGTRIA